MFKEFRRTVNDGGITLGSRVYIIADGFIYGTQGVVFGPGSDEQHVNVHVDRKPYDIHVDYLFTTTPELMWKLKNGETLLRNDVVYFTKKVTIT